MTTNRLYTVFSLITLLALVSAGAIAIPMLVGSLNTAPNTVSVSAEQARLDQRQGEWHTGLAAVSVDPEIARFVAYSNSLAEQARLAQRQGEWHAGLAAVSVDPEIARFVAYSNALAEQARLAQRRAEWNASSENIYAPLDQHERHATSVSIDPEIARFVAYGSALAEQARLAQRRGEWNAGSENIYAPLDQHERHASVAAAEPMALEFQRYLWYTSGVAGQPVIDVEQARAQWRATK